MRRILNHRLHLHELARIAEENRLRNRYLGDIHAPPNNSRRQQRPQRRNPREILQDKLDALSEWLKRGEMATT